MPLLLHLNLRQMPLLVFILQNVIPRAIQTGATDEP